MENAKPTELPLRKLGKTGLDVPIVGFGGLVLRELNEEDAFQLISHAITQGIRFFDTARHYQYSETALGKAQKRLGEERFIFSSKTMARDYGAAWIALQESLTALQVRQLHIYGFHHVQTLAEYHRIIGKDGALSALKEAKEQGMVAHIMLSSHARDVLLLAAAHEDIEILMFPYNIFDAEIFKPVLQLANKNNKGTIAIKLLAGGNICALKEGIQFVVAHPFSFVLTGAKTAMQLDVFVDHAILACHMNPDTMDTSTLKSSQKKLLDMDIPDCRHCAYCHDFCPNDIPISTIFELLKMTKLYRSGHRAKEDYHTLKKHGNDCIECGKCLHICPENIAIPCFLKKAHAVLTQAVTEKERLYHGETGKP